MGFVIVAGDAYDSPPLEFLVQTAHCFYNPHCNAISQEKPKFLTFLHDFINRLLTGCPLQISYGRLLTCLFYFQLIIQSLTAIFDFTLKSLVAIFMHTHDGYWEFRKEACCLPFYNTRRRFWTYEYLYQYTKTKLFSHFDWFSPMIY